MKLLVSFEQTFDDSAFRVCFTPGRPNQITMVPKVSVPLTLSENSKGSSGKSSLCIVSRLTIAYGSNILMQRKWR